MADGTRVDSMDKSQSKPRTTAAQHVSPRWMGTARYRIVVGKRLSPTWSDRLAGMEMQSKGQGYLWGVGPADTFGPEWLFKLSITPVIKNTLFAKTK